MQDKSKGGLVGRGAGGAGAGGRGAGGKKNESNSAMD